jgi:hypothetical protein
MAAASADEVVGASAMSPQGEMRSATQHLRYDIVDKQNESTGLSAMMRTTAFPASIIAQMMDKFVAVSDGGAFESRSRTADKKSLIPRTQGVRPIELFGYLHR